MVVWRRVREEGLGKVGWFKEKRGQVSQSCFFTTPTNLVALTRFHAFERCRSRGNGAKSTLTRHFGCSRCCIASSGPEVAFRRGDYQASQDYRGCLRFEENTKRNYSKLQHRRYIMAKRDPKDVESSEEEEAYEVERILKHKVSSDQGILQSTTEEPTPT